MKIRTDCPNNHLCSILWDLTLLCTPAIFSSVSRGSKSRAQETKKHQKSTKISLRKSLWSCRSAENSLTSDRLSDIYSTLKNQPEHLMRSPAGTPHYQQPFNTNSFYRNATFKICTPQRKIEDVFRRVLCVMT